LSNYYQKETSALPLFSFLVERRFNALQIQAAIQHSLYQCAYVCELLVGKGIQKHKLLAQKDAKVNDYMEFIQINSDSDYLSSMLKSALILLKMNRYNF